MYNFFAQKDDVIAVMSEKEDGNMKIRGMQKNDVALNNRKEFCEKNGISFDNLVNACVTHSSNVEIIDNLDKNFYQETDALVTNKKNIFLSITTADCFPVVFHDPKSEVVGVAHAGWRGIVSDIVPATISAMQKLGATIDNMQIEIGPGISQNNFDFEFGEVLEQFGRYNQDQYIIEGSTIEKVKIDLTKIMQDQLMHFGVLDENISTCELCTFEEERFFSARRHEGDSFSAMLTVIGMR